MNHVDSPSIGERALLAYARRFPVRRGKYRAVNALWRAVAGDDSMRIAPLLSGGFMRCDLRDSQQRQIYFFGTYLIEKENLDCWSEIARNSAVIFDVGANVGIYTITALACRPDAEVIAFEPTPQMVARFRENATINNFDVTLCEVALSDTEGFAFLHRFDLDGQNCGQNVTSTEHPNASGERVRTRTLDGYCADHGIGRIDLLKVDVQGTEPAVLRGATRMLSSGCIGTIFIELNWDMYADSPSCPAPLSINQLVDAGYWFAPPRAPLQWRKAGPWLRAHSDIVARVA